MYIYIYIYIYGSKNWLQRAILYRHKELLLSREDWSFKPDEYIYIKIGRFFINNFGFINSFGLALFVERDMIILHDWELVRCQGKSYAKD